MDVDIPHNPTHPFRYTTMLKLNPTHPLDTDADANTDPKTIDASSDANGDGRKDKRSSPPEQTNPPPPESDDLPLGSSATNTTEPRDELASFLCSLPRSRFSILPVSSEAMDKIVVDQVTRMKEMRVRKVSDESGGSGMTFVDEPGVGGRPKFGLGAGVGLDVGIGQGSKLGPWAGVGEVEGIMNQVQ